jgi:phage host-nuclease inhibitor protein Gam
MARKRIENVPKLKTWDDVDMNLMEVLEHEVATHKLEGEMNMKLAEIKEEYKDKIEPHKLKIKVLEKEMQEFAEENRHDMDGKKSKIFTHGTISFRKSTKVSIPKKLMDEAIRKLKLMKLTNCITVKETINKDELKKQPMDTLIKVGASLKTDDTFGYETNKESIPD